MARILGVHDDTGGDLHALYLDDSTCLVCPYCYRNFVEVSDLREHRSGGRCKVMDHRSPPVGWSVRYEGQPGFGIAVFSYAGSK